MYVFWVLIPCQVDVLQIFFPFPCIAFCFTVSLLCRSTVVQGSPTYFCLDAYAFGVISKTLPRPMSRRLLGLLSRSVMVSDLTCKSKFL